MDSPPRSPRDAAPPRRRYAPSDWRSGCGARSCGRTRPSCATLEHELRPRPGCRWPGTTCCCSSSRRRAPAADGRAGRPCAAVAVGADPAGRPAAGRGAGPPRAVARRRPRHVHRADPRGVRARCARQRPCTWAGCATTGSHLRRRRAAPAAALCCGASSTTRGRMSVDGAGRRARRSAVVRDSLGVGVAVGAYGFAFGAASVAAGLSVLQSCLLSLLAFTGGTQFAVVGVVAGGGTLAAALAQRAAARLAQHPLRDAHGAAAARCAACAACWRRSARSTSRRRWRSRSRRRRCPGSRSGGPSPACSRSGTCPTLVGALARVRSVDPAAFGLDAVVPGRVPRPARPAAARRRVEQRIALGRRGDRRGADPVHAARRAGARGVGRAAAGPRRADSPR